MNPFWRNLFLSGVGSTTNQINIVHLSLPLKKGVNRSFRSFIHNSDRTVKSAHHSDLKVLISMTLDRVGPPQKTAWVFQPPLTKSARFCWCNSLIHVSFSGFTSGGKEMMKNQPSRTANGLVWNTLRLWDAPNKLKFISYVLVARLTWFSTGAFQTKPGSIEYTPGQIGGGLSWHTKKMI